MVLARRKISLVLVDLHLSHTSLFSNGEGILPNDFIHLEVGVMFGLGLVGKLIAQPLCQCLSHVVFYYHRKVELAASGHFKAVQESHKKCDVEEDTIDYKHHLCTHEFRQDHQGKMQKVIVHRKAGHAILLVWILITFLLLLGSTLPLFSMHNQGLIGKLIHSLQREEQIIEYHSLVSISLLISAIGEDMDGVLAFLVTYGGPSFFLYGTLLLPIGLAASLVYQWFGSLTTNQRRRLLFLHEVALAWQTTEVILVSVGMSTW